MSFLRKQESRLLGVCSSVPAGQAGTLRYFLDSRFRGNDTPQPASFCSGAVFSRSRRDELLHSAKMLQKPFYRPDHQAKSPSRRSQPANTTVIIQKKSRWLLVGVRELPPDGWAPTPTDFPETSWEPLFSKRRDPDMGVPLEISLPWQSSERLSQNSVFPYPSGSSLKPKDMGKPLFL